MDPKRDLDLVIAPILPLVESGKLQKWIAAGLASSDGAGGYLRRLRKLPAGLVIMLMVLAAMLREYSLRMALVSLGPTLKRIAGGNPDGVAPSALPQARQRLGEAPVKAVFEEMTKDLREQVAAAPRWRGLSVCGIDGTTLCVADTPENDQAFGRPTRGKKQGGYPLVRLLTLTSTRLHTVLGAAHGGYCGKGQGETTLLKTIEPIIPDTSVTLLDRGFVSWPALWNIASRGKQRHFLLQPKKNHNFVLVKNLGQGDSLVEIKVSTRTRKMYPQIPKRLCFRRLTYLFGGKPKTLLTSLLDPKTYPANELIRLYAERWENELVFDELKTKLLGGAVTMRSKSPVMVRQEVWACLIAFNLLRMVIVIEAFARGVPAPQISFKTALQSVRLLLMAKALYEIIAASPRASRTRLLAWLPDSILVLPLRRSRRLYPRAVKLQVSTFPKKKTAGLGTLRDNSFQLFDIPLN